MSPAFSFVLVCASLARFLGASTRIACGRWALAATKVSRSANLVRLGTFFERKLKSRRKSGVHDERLVKSGTRIRRIARGRKDNDV